MSDVRDFDAELRSTAMAWLQARTGDSDDVLSTEDLLDFRFHGQPFRLMDAQRGIRKPKELDSALSIRTTYRSDPTSRPYADEIRADGLISYKWRGDDPQHAENRALREAQRMSRPLIWFFGVGSGLYRPVFPVLIVAEEPERQQFVLAVASVAGMVGPSSRVEEQLREYVVVESRRRLHQPVFRATVLHAYSNSCAVCALRHRELLDAAHIIPDSEEGGIAAVRNGLAMCKLHHAAYDSNLLGIRPADLTVEIRQDLLAESDGPMLRHGLQGRHGQKLMVVPGARKERPDPELLALRYSRFLEVG